MSRRPVVTDADVCRCTCGAWSLWDEICWYCTRLQPPKPIEGNHS